MKSEIAHTSAGAIEYTLRGSGPTVLVCHGTSSDCFSTEVTQPLVEAGFQVLTPSRPGYGRTPMNVGASASAAAAAFVALMDTLHIRACSVMGISGGGPTGLALAAQSPQRVQRLILAAAITRTEERPNEPAYKSQVQFYGPMHSVMWGLLGLMSRLMPRGMARQTLFLFSEHDPDEGLSRLSPEDVRLMLRFYEGRSARRGALIDFTHTVVEAVLRSVTQPTLVVHSREDKSVPFAHAEWALKHIPQAELCEAGFTGHFFWIGPDFERIMQRMIGFLRA